MAYLMVYPLLTTIRHHCYISKRLLAQQISTVVAEAQFFDTNDNCPTCEQGITEDLKGQKLKKAKSRAVELKKGLTKANSEARTIEDRLNVLN